MNIYEPCILVLAEEPCEIEVLKWNKWLIIIIIIIIIITTIIIIIIIQTYWGNEISEILKPFKREIDMLNQENWGPEKEFRRHSKISNELSKQWNIYINDINTKILSEAQLNMKG